MTLHDIIFSAAIIVFGGIFSGVVQAKFSALDPNAKRIARLERRVSELSKQLGIEEAPLTDVQELIARGSKSTLSSCTANRREPV